MAVSTALESGTESQDVGARTAASARADLPTRDVDCCQVVCSARYDYRRVLDGIHAELGDDVTVFVGSETYGERCMQRGQMSGYHNTTAVNVLLPE